MEIPNPGSNGRLEAYFVVVRYDHIRALNTPTQTPTYHLQFTFLFNSVSATYKFIPWDVHKHPQNKKNEIPLCFTRTALSLSGIKKLRLRYQNGPKHAMENAVQRICAEMDRGEVNGHPK